MSSKQTTIRSHQAHSSSHQANSSSHQDNQSEKYIGSDETLKGDTFGGIVVAAVYASDNVLMQYHVRDSKLIADHHIEQIAQQIKSNCVYSLCILTPKEYNDSIASGVNVTQLLNKLHTRVADEIRHKINLPTGTIHIVDHYPGCSVGTKSETKAESHYPAVAAASILARQAALNQMDALSKQAGFIVPKGSTHVLWALERLKKENQQLEYFVKTSFKNVTPFL